MRNMRLIAVALGCSAAVAGLAGCGGDKQSDAAKPVGAISAKASPEASTPPGIESLTAEQISQRAKDALLAAPSVTITFDAPHGGQHVFGHLALDRKSDCVGELGLGTRGHVELIKNATQVWMKPDTTFWKSVGGPKRGEAAAELFKGRYLSGKVTDPQFAELASFCDLKALTKGIAKPDAQEKVTKGPLTTVDGVPVITLHDVSSKGAGEVYVATHGVPYVVKVQETSGKDLISMTFSSYGTPVRVQAPPPNLVIDTAKLKGLRTGTAV